MNSHGAGKAKGESVATATQERSVEVSRSVEVQIGGHRLSVRSNHAPDFVRQLAAHIDGKVTDLQERAPHVPLPKLLMLASMTVAEELFETRLELDALRSSVGESTDEMLDLLDAIELDAQANAP